MNKLFCILTTVNLLLLNYVPIAKYIHIFKYKHMYRNTCIIHI